jgi:NAD(P)H dehydrogenase (quinone)
MDVNVLVVFYSRYGNAERLALAAGVGAIQAKANIRLRRVPDLADAQTIESDTAWSENLQRMNMDYVPPREADAPWADVIFFATPADSSAEIERYLAMLRPQGPFAGKIAAPFCPGSKPQSVLSLYAGAAALGMIVVPKTSQSGYAVDLARNYGRLVVEIARALKTQSPAAS